MKSALKASNMYVSRWFYVFYEVMTPTNTFLLIALCHAYRKNTLTQFSCSYNRHFKALSRAGQASTEWVCRSDREKERDQGPRAIKVPVLAGQRNAGSSRDGQSNSWKVKFSQASVLFFPLCVTKSRFMNGSHFNYKCNMTAWLIESVVWCYNYSALLLWITFISLIIKKKT